MLFGVSGLLLLLLLLLFIGASPAGVLTSQKPFGSGVGIAAKSGWASDNFSNRHAGAARALRSWGPPKQNKGG